MARRVALGLLAALVLCSTALADADPASDILLVANVFYPYGSPVAQSLQATMNTELTAAHRAHFPIKVALIATSMDLGAIPQLYAKPREYAAYLDQEISFGGRVPLLVVMPNGYGGAALGARAAAVLASLRKPSARTGNALTRAAIPAVRMVAEAAGHPLGQVGARSTARTGGGGSGVAAALAILIAVCAALAAAILAARRRGARKDGARRR